MVKWFMAMAGMVAPVRKRPFGLARLYREPWNSGRKKPSLRACEARRRLERQGYAPLSVHALTTPAGLRAPPLKDRRGILRTGGLFPPSSERSRGAQLFDLVRSGAEPVLDHGAGVLAELRCRAAVLHGRRTQPDGIANSSDL